MTYLLHNDAIDIWRRRLMLRSYTENLVSEIIIIIIIFICSDKNT